MLRVVESCRTERHQSSILPENENVLHEEVAMKAQSRDHQPTPTRMAIAFASATGLAAVAALAIVSLVARPVAAAETSNAKPTAKASEDKAAPAKPKTISLEKYMAGVSGKSAGEQAAFAKAHTGATVTWTGYVRTINKNLSPDGAFYQLILMSRLPEEGGAPVQLFLAQFAGAAEKQLLALQKEQKVTVSGTLKADQNPGLPTLADAKLMGS